MIFENFKKSPGVKGIPPPRWRDWISIKRIFINLLLFILLPLYCLGSSLSQVYAFNPPPPGENCEFSTEPSGHIYVDTEGITFYFTSFPIKKALLLTELNPNAQLQWHIEGQSFASCIEPLLLTGEDEYLTKEIVLAIDENKKFQITTDKNFDPFRCRDSILSLKAGAEKIITIQYKVGGSQSTICSGSYKIEERKSTAKVEATHDPNNSGDIYDMSWEYIISEIELLPPFDTVSAKFNGKDILFEETPPSDGIIRRPIPTGTRSKHNTLIAYSRHWPTGCVGYGCHSEEVQLSDPYEFDMAELGTTLPPPTPTLSPTPSPELCGQPPCNVTPKYCNDKCNICPGCPGDGSGRYDMKPPNMTEICDQLPTTPIDFKAACWKCQPNGIWTAIGCLPWNYSDLISGYIFTFGIGLAGGISFLYFLYGVFLIMTSAGNPERVAQAKQILVSTVSGLLLIIFSVFFLKIIGIDILHIPGFE
ncbi:hypothetical protein A2Y99_00235 [Candidatus Gottesmanbacteria bacterium RBG_13_37_7]|uniref:Uncharacterized protein n=1 Tax=Candidatus Gottesmanbacteria bacterium RBG_13_37_7 TaxID=1798369 RepID=A0A1F5YGX7_9BACT|nr:MAG: hypothetical protein A2Y99_00235 [Candidatus Gottesmanbacteria bacterium RBG_13_37_7]